jgi:hypothetical protein
MYRQHKYLWSGEVLERLVVIILDLVINILSVIKYLSIILRVKNNKIE